MEESGYILQCHRFRQGNNIACERSCIAFARLCDYSIDLPHAVTFLAKYPWNLHLKPYGLLPDWNGTQSSYATPSTNNYPGFAYRASNNAPFWTHMENSTSSMKFLSHILIVRQPQRMVNETCGHGDSAFSRGVGFPRLEPMSTFLSSPGYANSG